MNKKTITFTNNNDINNKSNEFIKNIDYDNINIVINSKNVYFLQCNFSNNTNIIINNSKINFKNCRFSKNYNNIITTYKSKVYFNNCYIHNNYTNYKSLFEFHKSNIVFIGYNKLFHNTSKNNDLYAPLYGSLLASYCSTIKFSNKSTINNNHNYGNWNMGILYLYKSTLILTDIVNINDNTSIKSIIYCEMTNVKIENKVMVNNNQSNYFGIFFLKNCYTIVSDFVIFKKNYLSSSGVITCYSYNTTLIIKNNVLFDSNIIYPKLNQKKKINLCGSCIYINTFSDKINVIIKDFVKFTNNYNEKGFAGAIYFGSLFKTNYTDNILNIKNNVYFHNNKALISNDIFTNYNLYIDNYVNFDQCFVNSINNITINSYLKFKEKIKIYEYEPSEISKNINLNLMH